MSIHNCVYILTLIGTQDDTCAVAAPPLWWPVSGTVMNEAKVYIQLQLYATCQTGLIVLNDCGTAKTAMHPGPLSCSLFLLDTRLSYFLSRISMYSQ
jgi:hypothetical protein